MNLCICGLFFTTSSSDDTPADEENNEDIESNGQYETDSIGWNRNIVILSPRRERPDEDQGFPAPQLVDEENTPILLNAAAGLFFPICHTEAATEKQISSDGFSLLLAWQSRFFQVHILVFNTLIMTTVIVVYVLVSSVPSFNYNYNVLDFFWLKTACAFLFLMAGLSFVLSFQTHITKLFRRALRWIQKKERREATGEDLWRTTYLSLLASLVICLPAIVSIVLFHVNPPSTPLIFLAKQGLGNSRELVVISSTVPSGFTNSPSHQTDNCI